MEKNCIASFRIEHMTLEDYGSKLHISGRNSKGEKLGHCIDNYRLTNKVTPKVGWIADVFDNGDVRYLKTW